MKKFHPYESEILVPSCVCACAFACACVRAWVRVWVRGCVCVCLCMCTCMHAWVCSHVCVYVHVLQVLISSPFYLRAPPPPHPLIIFGDSLTIILAGLESFMALDDLPASRLGAETIVLHHHPSLLP